MTNYGNNCQFFTKTVRLYGLTKNWGVLHPEGSEESAEIGIVPYHGSLSSLR